MSDRLERRRFARYLIVLPLLYKSRGPAPSRVGVGWTRNLGEGGTCAELNERLQLGTPLTARLQMDRGLVEVEAHVVWVQDPAPVAGGIQHGLAFDSIPPDQQHILQDVLVSRGEKRRAAVRLPLDIAVTCRPKGQAGPSLPGRTGNISRGGLLLYLSQVVPPETVLELTLHSPYGPLTAEGVIVWVAPPERRTPGEPIRHGLRFTVLGWTTSLSLGLFLVEAPDEIPRQEYGRPH